MQVSYVYDGTEKTFKLASVTNEIAGDETALLSSIAYTDETQVNAGEYTVQATIPSTSNYVFATGATATSTWSIAQKALTAIVTVEDNTYVYDGTIYDKFGCELVGLVGGEDVDDVFEGISYLTYDKNTGAAKDAKNVGVYEIRLSYIEADSFDNYVITWTYGRLEIAAREIELRWSSVTEYKQGRFTEANLKPTAIIGAVDSDIAMLLQSWLVYSGFETTLGSHVLTATCTSSNYTIKNPTFTYTVIA
jgi:hypothetical protein